MNYMDFLTKLLETALLYGAKLSFSLGRFDLRWFKILRCWPIPCRTVTVQACPVYATCQGVSPYPLTCKALHVLRVV